jgi:hypothetical protein
MANVSLDSALNAINAKYDKLTSGSDMSDDMKLQYQMQQESEKTSLLSNLLKTLHEQAMARYIAR